jgi:protein-S-isoprenylcysteine O-methyltransferase Ste14
VTPVDPVIQALWVAFLLFWLVMALRAKPSLRGGSWWRGLALRAALVCAVVLLFEVPAVDTFASGFGPLSRTAGIALCAAGLALAIWARFHLGRNWGVPMSLRAGHELVTTGPYALMRHPIYSGILLAMLGSGIAEGAVSLALFLVFAVYFAVCARSEERTMSRQFPAAYSEYMKRTKMLVPYLLAVPLGALVAIHPPAAGAATLGPYEIFERARDVWSSQQYPPYVSYTIVVDVDQKGVQKTDHYVATYDSRHDRVYADVVSKEQKTDPYFPRGINMSIDPKRKFQTLFKRPVGDPERAVDYLGVPLLAPNFSFGIAPYVPQFASAQANQAELVEQIRREFHDPMHAQQEADLSRVAGLKQIANVVSANRRYIITDKGIETINGTQAYHLSLRPVRPDPRLRLRELWIATRSFATLQLVTQGNFADDAIPWLITFANVGGAQYIASETAEKPVSNGRFTYERAAISFQDIKRVQPTEQQLWDPVVPTNNVLVEPEGG